jgi:hypothetical protein
MRGRLFDSYLFIIIAYFIMLRHATVAGDLHSAIAYSLVLTAYLVKILLDAFKKRQE